MTSKAYTEPQQQKQWDALFKHLIPKATFIRSMIEDRYRIKRDNLLALTTLPTDLPSVTVAMALHQKNSYKELRGDGMFIAKNPRTVVSTEYQSTHNPGMRLRFAMYMEAAIENNNRLAQFNFINVLIYSGRSDRNRYREDHLQEIDGYLKYLVVDLNSTDRAALERGSIYDAIVRLSLPDADRVELFWRVISRIDTEVSDADERVKLRAAVVAASLNKSGMWNRISREIAMDPILKQELETFIPFLEDQLYQDERKRREEAEHALADSERRRLSIERRRLADIVEIKGGTEEFLDTIRNTDDDWIEEHADEIWTMALHGDVSTISARYEQ